MSTQEGMRFFLNIKTGIIIYLSNLVENTNPSHV